MNDETSALRDAHDLIVTTTNQTSLIQAVQDVQSLARWIDDCRGGFFTADEEEMFLDIYSALTERQDDTYDGWHINRAIKVCRAMIAYRAFGFTNLEDFEEQMSI